MNCGEARKHSAVELLPIFVRTGEEASQYKAGYIDFGGLTVIRPKFDDARPFSEGLASVKVGRLWGAIDPSGNMVVAPCSQIPLYFSEGLADFDNKGKRGVLDRRGNVIVAPIFRAIGDYCEGLAYARCTPPKIEFGFLNRDGGFQIPMFFEDARSFSEGIAPVKLDSKWTYIDKSGKLAFESKFDGLALPFSEGLARVCDGGHWGFINHSGRFEVTPQFEDARDFKEGFAAVKASGKWGFIGTSGQFGIQPQFDSVGPFSEGLAAARLSGGGMCGFIDRDGRFVISPRFRDTGRFLRGRCFVKTDREIGYIDETGRYIWDGPYVDVWITSDLHL